ncbi:cytochrome P450 [Ramaria rubella]|nr:cytochrome P450 [Ramaria rubella]
MHYRTRFLLDLARVFLVPPIITTLILRVVRPSLLQTWLTPIIATLAIPFVFTLRTLWTSNRHASAARRLGALPIPVVRGSWPGNIDVLKRLLHGWRNGYINETLREFFEEYQSPTINVRILWVDQIWTMDPNHIKHILVSGFQHFDKGAPQRERMKGFLGTGIFAADDEVWKMHRSMTRPFLAKSRTSDIKLFARHTDDAIAHLERLAAAGRPDVSVTATPASALDIQELSQRYTLDIALDSFFGIDNVRTMLDPLSRPGSTEEKDGSHHVAEAYSTDDDLATSSAEIKTFARAMEQAADTTILRARQGVLWPLIEFKTDKTASLAATMRPWINAVICRVQKHGRAKEKTGEEGGDAETFVEHLVRSTDDETFIRDQLINMTLGARDTTAALITFTLYFLALHPEVYTRLRNEVMELCPPGESLPEGDRLKDFVYLRAVLNETLRVFPSVPINTRYSTTESVFPPAAYPYTATAGAATPRHYASSLYMPPNTSISLVTLLMQRRMDLWGADAEEFRPTRWLGEDNDLGDKPDESTGEPRRGEAADRRPEWFVPFSAGPRLCLGQNFAYLEATYFFIRVIQCGFVFNLAPACQPPETRPPQGWKAEDQTPAPEARDLGVFVKNKGRQRKEECWPGTAFTLYSKGGLWMYVSKVKEPGH